MAATEPVRIVIAYSQTGEAVVSQAKANLTDLSNRLGALSAQSLTGRLTGNALQVAQTDIARTATHLRNSTQGMVSSMESGVLRFSEGATRMAHMAAYAMLGVGAAGTYAAKQIANSFIQVNEEFAALEITLRSSLRSLQTATALRAELVKITALSPIPFQDLANATRAFSVIPYTRNQMAMQAAQGTLSEDSGTFRSLMSLVAQMVASRPDKTAADAVFSIREALAGQFRSLIRRFEVPSTGLAAVSGKTTKELTEDPEAALDAMKKYFGKLITPQALVEMSRVPTKLFANIKEQLFVIPAQAIGKAGFYDLFTNYFLGFYNRATAFMSAHSEPLIQQVSDSFGRIFGVVTDMTGKLAEIGLGKLNFGKGGYGANDRPGQPLIERAATAIADGFTRAAEVLPVLIERVSAFWDRLKPALTALLEFFGFIASKLLGAFETSPILTTMALLGRNMIASVMGSMISSSAGYFASGAATRQAAAAIARATPTGLRQMPTFSGQPGAAAPGTATGGPVIAPPIVVPPVPIVAQLLGRPAAPNAFGSNVFSSLFSSLTATSGPIALSGNQLQAAFQQVANNIRNNGFLLDASLISVTRSASRFVSDIYRVDAQVSATELESLRRATGRTNLRPGDQIPNALGSDIMAGTARLTGYAPNVMVQDRINALLGQARRYQQTLVQIEAINAQAVAAATAGNAALQAQHVQAVRRAELLAQQQFEALTLATQAHNQGRVDVATAAEAERARRAATPLGRAGAFLGSAVTTLGSMLKGIAVVTAAMLLLEKAIESLVEWANRLTKIREDAQKERIADITGRIGIGSELRETPALLAKSINDQLAAIRAAVRETNPSLVLPEAAPVRFQKPDGSIASGSISDAQAIADSLQKEISGVLKAYNERTDYTPLKGAILKLSELKQSGLATVLTPENLPQFLAGQKDNVLRSPHPAENRASDYLIELEMKRRQINEGIVSATLASHAALSKISDGSGESLTKDVSPRYLSEETAKRFEALKIAAVQYLDLPTLLAKYFKTSLGAAADRIHSLQDSESLTFSSELQKFSEEREKFLNPEKSALSRFDQIRRLVQSNQDSFAGAFKTDSRGAIPSVTELTGGGKEGSGVGLAIARARHEILAGLDQQIEEAVKLSRTAGLGDLENSDVASQLKALRARRTEVASQSFGRRLLDEARSKYQTSQLSLVLAGFDSLLPAIEDQIKDASNTVQGSGASRIASSVRRTLEAFDEVVGKALETVGIARVAGISGAAQGNVITRKAATLPVELFGPDFISAMTKRAEGMSRSTTNETDLGGAAEDIRTGLERLALLTEISSKARSIVSGLSKKLAQTTADIAEFSAFDNPSGASPFTAVLEELRSDQKQLQATITRAGEGLKNWLSSMVAEAEKVQSIILREQAQTKKFRKETDYAHLTNLLSEGPGLGTGDYPALLREKAGAAAQNRGVNFSPGFVNLMTRPSAEPFQIGTRLAKQTALVQEAPQMLATYQSEIAALLTRQGLITATSASLEGQVATIKKLAEVSKSSIGPMSEKENISLAEGSKALTELLPQLTASKVETSEIVKEVENLNGKIAELKKLKDAAAKDIRDTRGGGAFTSFAEGVGDVGNRYYEEMLNFRQAGIETTQAIKSNLGDAFHSFTSGAKSAKEAFSDFGKSVLDTIGKIASQKLAEQIIGLGVKALGGISFGGGVGSGDVSEGAPLGGSYADSAFGGGGTFEIAGKAAGGFISKGIGGKDDVPALLMRGEYVIPASIVQRHGIDYFDRMLARESIEPQHFAGGGPVGDFSTPAPSYAPQGGSTPENRAGNVTVNMTITENYTGTPSQVDTATAQKRNAELAAAVKGMVQEVLLNSRRPGGSMRDLGTLKAS